MDTAIHQRSDTEALGVERSEAGTADATPLVTLVVSVDTEEDNWAPTRSGVTARNVRELPALDALFRRLGGVKATYFTAHAVAKDPEGVAVLSDLYEGGLAEIGAHLHPWNTPPLVESVSPRNTMLKNLPAPVQLAKVQTLTDALEGAFGMRPRTFRAGRYGLGPDTVRALTACGYEVDSSVTPFVSWERFDDGPNFVGAPVHPYRLSGTGGDVRVPDPAGALLELPVSCSLSRGPLPLWRPLWSMLQTRVARHSRITSVTTRLGVLRAMVLNPEVATASEMLAGARRLLAAGVRYVHLTLHSPSLTPGLTPFVATAGDRERMFGKVERFVEGLARSASLRFATVAEAAARSENLVVEAPGTTVQPSASSHRERRPARDPRVA